MACFCRILHGRAPLSHMSPSRGQPGGLSLVSSTVRITVRWGVDQFLRTGSDAIRREKPCSSTVCRWIDSVDCGHDSPRPPCCCPWNGTASCRTASSPRLVLPKHGTSLLGHVMEGSRLSFSSSLGVIIRGWRPFRGTEAPVGVFSPGVPCPVSTGQIFKDWTRGDWIMEKVGSSQTGHVRSRDLISDESQHPRGKGDAMVGKTDMKWERQT